MNRIGMGRSGAPTKQWRRQRNHFDKGRDSSSSIRNVLLKSAIPIGIVVMLLTLWFVSELVLMVFAAILAAMLLDAAANQIEDRSGLSHSWSLTLVTLIGVACAAGIALYALPRLVDQAREFADKIPSAIEMTESWLGDWGFSEGRIQQILNTSWISSAAFNVMDVMVAGFVVVVVGLYLAADPERYRNMLLGAAPSRAQDSVKSILDDVTKALKRWLVARVLLMILNGFLTTIGLVILGVPLALLLGVLAGLLNFIPNFGPFIAAVPSILLAFSQDTRTGISVALLYLVLQMLDGYVFTPLADKKAVHLPPALTLTFQVFMGLVLNSGGLLLATPLLTVIHIVLKNISSIKSQQPPTRVILDPVAQQEREPVG